VRVQLRDLDERQKVAAYSAADLVLLPFSAAVAVEPPLTLLEALACEAVVALAPHANRSQIVSDRVNGLCYETPEQLAAGLTWLHGLSAERRTALGQRARAHIVEHYSFAAAAQALRAVWRAIGDE
jgi:glycosyltransferase involved in cell wall biosynthesis